MDFRLYAQQYRNKSARHSRRFEPRGELFVGHIDDGKRLARDLASELGDFFVGQRLGTSPYQQNSRVTSSSVSATPGQHIQFISPAWIQRQSAFATMTASSNEAAMTSAGLI
jgi:hypothetical protein